MTGDPLPPWGIALEALRARAKLTQRNLVEIGLMGSGDWHRLCRRPRGPTVERLDKVLRALGCTWADWAEAFEDAKGTLDPAPRRPKR